MITSEDGPRLRKNDERVNIHISDIKPKNLVSLGINLGQMSVSGDDSWAKRTLQKYSLNGRKYGYGFRLTPFDPNDNQIHELKN